MPILPMEEVETAYYLRMQALDQPGVMAGSRGSSGEQGISIEAIMQKEPEEGRDPCAPDHAYPPGAGRPV